MRAIVLVCAVLILALSFIDAAMGDGTKEEACDRLQKTWNELCALRQEIREAETRGRESMREDAARVADAAIRLMTEIALSRPENSASRDRCTGRAREASCIATAIRNLKP